MKVLIAYDGSESSDAAIRDLRRAGLPDKGEMLVLSVAEIAPERPASPSYLEWGGFAGYDVATLVEEMMMRQNEIAQRGADGLRSLLPMGWSIRAQAVMNSAQRGIIDEADEWKPDLIVVGSHNTSAIGRMFIGTVSHGVLTHAPCSVRIGRDIRSTFPSRDQLTVREIANRE